MHGEKPEIIRIPTEREGVILKTATALDDEAYLLVNRPFRAKVRPSDPLAPDNDVFKKLRVLRSREDPSKLSMSIWDTQRFENSPVFAGFVELRPESEAENTAKVGAEIAEIYRRYGYAATALRAIMNYGRENLGIDTFKAEVQPSNYASQQLVQRLGFEFTGQRHNTLTYALEQPSDPAQTGYPGVSKSNPEHS
jgi:RimJ/RimL family protein N-acetyltransferase